MVNFPNEGDIIMLNLSPTKGNVRSGFRPCIVLSDSRFNKVLGLSIVAPITNQKKGYPFEVQLRDGMKTTGVILTDHLCSVDLKSRMFKIVESAPTSLLDECREYVFSFMGGEDV
ncbi:mRNA interferase MazF [Alkalibacterium subtropicum]|uniref:mRNA interferase MazF n=1 Tax=Alkalibacterium subtropicum TaxID=753702 RepID=A0A1I1L2F9_9LACT|nr:type II toxin-antitoxin system PemK/MazF family toxin [Alkalibacterium subtropicum]SFC67236.1 mRNA interferase MazF [Alkalibacterium subtropicum]